MGIPSYYRTLCKNVPSLLQRKLPKESIIGSLYIDFNCIVYHCIRRPGTPIYPGEDGRISWENKLIDIVCNYVKELETLCRPTQGVYIAIDGVVPMAKMRQQRKRRHKSVWLAAKEVACGKPISERWDSNCITPGTEFMERLALQLKKKDVSWIISSSDEPGEGEQKLFDEMRRRSGKLDTVVYGLDADLILMSMLYQVNNMSSTLWLFREETESGGKIMYNDDKEVYTYLNIPTLVNAISKGAGADSSTKASYIRDYTAAMILLGNDFLPHGIWFTIRDGGYYLLQELLENVRKTFGCLIKDGFEWNVDALKYILGELASREEVLLTQWITKKFNSRPRISTEVVSDWEKEMEAWNNSPITLREESVLLSSTNPVTLSNDWRSVYNEKFLKCKNKVDLDYVLEKYISGLDWSLKYISFGQDAVSWTWMFPMSYPPLMSDIYNGLDKFSITGPTDVNPNVTPQEQLALVLPIQSWRYVRDPLLKRLPTLFPYLWNFDLNFCTSGKKMMWECDPYVPLLLPSRLRFLQKLTDSINTVGGK